MNPDAPICMTVLNVAFGLGSNLGDRLAALQGAVDLICADPGVSTAAVSGIYETDPVGGPEQPDYLNAVVVCDTELSPVLTLQLAHRVEAAWNRTREVHWGPRTLDVDVLAYGQLVTKHAQLTLPHPRCAERAFVLVPWAEVDPDFMITGKATVAQCLANCSASDRSSVRVRGDLALTVPSDQ